MSLIQAIRNNKITSASFSRPYSDDWNDEEILAALTAVECPNLGLDYIPSLPNVTYLNCSFNRITSLSFLPACRELNCSRNRLDFLPPLPLAEKVECSYNRLISLPPLPKCVYLDASSNALNSLPSLPVAKIINIRYTHLTRLSPKDYPECETLLVYSDEEEEKEEEGEQWKEEKEEKKCDHCQSPKKVVGPFDRPFWVPDALPWDAELWKSVQIPIPGRGPTKAEEDALLDNFRRLLEVPNKELACVMTFCLAQRHAWFWTKYPDRLSVVLLPLQCLRTTPELTKFLIKLEADLRLQRPVWVVDDIEWKSEEWDRYKFVGLGSAADKDEFVEITKLLLKKCDATTGRVNRIRIISMMFRLNELNPWMMSAHVKYRKVAIDKCEQFIEEDNWPAMFSYLKNIL